MDHDAKMMEGSSMYIIKGDERVNKILIAEDEAAIANLVRTVLTDAGYRCVWAPDGTPGRGPPGTGAFRPGPAGHHAPRSRRIRAAGLLQSSGRSRDLSHRPGRGGGPGPRPAPGAEDYLPKPFALSELLARVETVLRRCGKGEQLLRLEPDIEIDPAARIVRKGGQAVALTAKEFDLLVLFVQNKNVVLCRDRIFERVWNEEYLGDSRTVDLHVQRMRKKLGLEDRLTAVYKVGYRLEE